MRTCWHGVEIDGTVRCSNDLRTATRADWVDLASALRVVQTRHPDDAAFLSYCDRVRRPVTNTATIAAAPAVMIAAP